MISEMRKRLQRKGARRGFTLVELLIVIIIIGILAGAMLLVAGRSRDSAEASKIISNLRTVKAAALIWLTESPSGLPDSSWDGLDDDPSPLNAYLDKPISADDPYEFEIGTVTVSKITGYEDDGEGNQTPVYGSVTDTSAWLLGYDLGGVRSGVKTNLAAQAKSVGLYGTDEIDLSNAATEDPYYKGGENDNIVYVIVQ